MKTITVTVLTNASQTQCIDASVDEARVIGAITEIANRRNVSVHQAAESILRDNTFTDLQRKLGPAGARAVRTVAKRIYSEVA